MRARLSRVDAAHAKRIVALLFGCFLLLVVASCGGGGGQAASPTESWTSGWRKDSARPPVGDRSVDVDWDTADGAPAWSPDGQWIAFDSTRSGGGIYVVHSDGRGLRRIAKNPSAAYPAWSPNRTWLAFSTAKGVVVIRRDGSARRLLVRRRRVDQVKWSPDGRAIAFAVENADDSIDIYTKRLNSARPRRIVRSRIGRRFESFDWSRTGRVLSVEVGDGPVGVLSLRARSFRLVVNGVAYEPAWSPDGTRIAYQCAGEVCTVDADGTDRRVLTAVNGATEPAWSPDGRWIVFAREIYGNFANPTALYRVSADGRHLRNITFG